MLELNPQQQTRVARYHGQSMRFLRNAMDEANQARWSRCEELLWGSLTLAIKAVALANGDQVEGRREVEDYARVIGQQYNDRRIRNAFARLSSFAETADRLRESRRVGQQLISILEDVASAVERLWEMVPMAVEADGWDSETHVK